MVYSSSFQVNQMPIYHGINVSSYQQCSLCASGARGQAQPLQIASVKTTLLCKSTKIFKLQCKSTNFFILDLCAYRRGSSYPLCSQCASRARGQGGRHERSFGPARGPLGPGWLGPGPTKKSAGPVPQNKTENQPVRSG